MYSNDKRVVMTLDAGGTNFVFSAIQADKEIVSPKTHPSNSDNLEKCLATIEQGFREVMAELPQAPVAISFAFPGPADYPKGIISDLPNFPSFRGGVALGPFLEQKFGIPVFINNDGDLFAYGEAIAGVLPDINERLSRAGSIKQYHNLIGVTLGTGFGAGVVINGRLHCGDNSAGGDVWCTRNKKYPDMIAEEGVAIRAVQRVYNEVAGESTMLSPKDIYDIAEGTKQGNREAAFEAFRQMGEMAGNTLAHAATLVDGIIVIGGGLAGASKYIIPAMLAEMNCNIGTFAGDVFPRMQMKVYDVDNDFDAFAKGDKKTVNIPGSDKTICYDSHKRIGIAISKLGASNAIALGAYAFAISKLDS